MYTEIREAVAAYVSAKNKLYALGIIRTEKITAELGEWLFCNLYGAELAKSSSQKSWDAIIMSNEKNHNCKVQVKTNAKRPDNNARWTSVKIDLKKEEGLYFDWLSIIVFSNQLKIKEIYFLPFNIVREMLENTSDKNTIYWDRIPQEYKEDLAKFDQKVIEIFGIEGC